MTLAKVVMTGIACSYSKFSSAFSTVRSIARHSSVGKIVAAITDCGGDRINKTRTAPASN